MTKKIFIISLFIQLAFYVPLFWALLYQAGIRGILNYLGSFFVLLCIGLFINFMIWFASSFIMNHVDNETKK